MSFIFLFETNLQARKDFFCYLKAECMAALVHHVGEQLKQMSDAGWYKQCSARTCSAMLDTMALASFKRAFTCTHHHNISHTAFVK